MGKFRGFYLCGIDKESKHGSTTSSLVRSGLKVAAVGRMHILYQRP